MYLLVLRQNDFENRIGAFRTMENAKAFVRLIPGYEYCADETDPSYGREFIHKEQLSDYFEIRYQNLIYPLSRFSFPDKEDIEIDFLDFPLLDGGGEGLVDYVTRVDAYVIANGQARSYIKTREEGYGKVRKVLEQKGCEVERAFAGSEDGEAILYRKSGETEFHFLCHMDACAVDEWGSVQDWERWVEDQMYS